MIRINPHKILLTLLSINIVLVAAYVVSQITQKLEVPLNLNAEANVPSWYAGVQLLFIAIAAYLRGEQMRQENPSSHWMIYMLAALAATFLSADEIGMIHESLRPILTYHVFGQIDRPGGKSGAGLLVAAVYGVVALLLLTLFWKQALAFLQEKPGRASILLGVAIFGIGAVLVDEFMPYANELYEHAVEELLELCGTSLVLHGFLRRLQPVTIGCAPPTPSN